MSQQRYTPECKDEAVRQVTKRGRFGVSRPQRVPELRVEVYAWACFWVTSCRRGA
jgi:hypothetical protein